MSTTDQLTGDLNTVKLWEYEAWEQLMMDTHLGHMFNRGIIYFPEEGLGKSKGDEITFSYVGKSNQVPRGEGQTMRGHEEAIDKASHKMLINISRLGYTSPNKDTIEQQRTHINFDAQTRRVAVERGKEVLTQSVFNQLAGFNPTTFTGLDGVVYSSTADKLQVQGHNTPVAPSTNRIIRPASAANDQSITSAETLKLIHIDYALEKNMRQNQRMSMLPGMTFDLFISPEQLTDLEHDTTGAIQWLNIEIARLTAGTGNAIDKPYKNNIICAGKYKNVWIYVNPYVSYGVDTSTSAVIINVRRAVLCGSDAVSFTSPFGGRPTDDSVPMKFFEELYDNKYFKSTEGRLLYGIKKMIPALKEDIGVTVISTYAAAHA